MVVVDDFVGSNTDLESQESQLDNLVELSFYNIQPFFFADRTTRFRQIPGSSQHVQLN